MKSKQAQIQMVFLIAFIAAILLFTIILGYKVISNLKKSGEKAQLTEFYTNLKSRISEISENMDFSEKITLKVPENTKYMCFVDKSLLDDENLKQLYCSLAPSSDVYSKEKALVCSIIKEGINKNLFLFPNRESFYVGEVFVGEGIYCFPITKEEAEILLVGLGKEVYLEEIPPQTRFCKENNECLQDEFCSEKGVCIKKCYFNDDCSPLVCNFSTGRCVECTSNNDCKGGVCNYNLNKCVECLKNEDCLETQVCYNNKCVELHCEEKYNDSQSYCKDNEICVCHIENHEAKSKCNNCTGFCNNGVCENTCGNGVINYDSGEECEKDNLDGKNCYDLKDNLGYNFIGGNLKCNNCKFDTSECILLTKNYTITYKIQDQQVTNIFCFKESPINLSNNTKKCDFLKSVFTVLCNGNLSKCDHKIENYFKNNSSGMFNCYNLPPKGSPGLADAIILSYNGSSFFSFGFVLNVSGSWVAAYFNKTNLQINQSLKQNTSYVGNDFICYELCDEGKITLIVKNSILLDIIFDKKCDICNTWLNNLKCEYEDLCFDVITYESCPSNKCCCKV
ncbi:MAG: hypothetical protein ACP5OZ_03525 [Candidatus Woesearchaeota archaeon]